MSVRIFSAHGGEVRHRGVWVPRCSAEALLAIYEREAADASDYFHNDAKALADELREAMAHAYESEMA